MLSIIKSIQIRNLIAVAAILFYTSCKQDVPDAIDKHTESEHQEITEVTLTPEQAKAINLEMGNVVFRNLKTSLKANGRLVLPPQNQAQVSVLMGGIIKNIPVIEGQFVNKGQVLATMENSEFLQVQQEFFENKSSLKFLEAEFNRQSELQKENINATKTFQQTEADYNSALVKNKVLSEKLKLFGVNSLTLTIEKVNSSFLVVAPISGYIKHIDAFIGKFVEPNRQLFEIVDNHYLHIDLTIFEQDVAKVKVGQHVTFSIINDPHHSHKAKIFSMNKAFENNQQAIIAHAKIDETDDDLLPGMFIEARVQVDDYRAMSLPNEAIVSNGNDHYIYIEHEPNTFKQVEIKIGTSDMGFTEIIPFQKIEEKSRIVVIGAYYLLSQLTKGEGEHNH